jgi:hypothetical protein
VHCEPIAGLHADSVDGDRARGGHEISTGAVFEFEVSYGSSEEQGAINFCVGSDRQGVGARSAAGKGNEPSGAIGLRELIERLKLCSGRLTMPA